MRRAFALATLCASRTVLADYALPGPLPVNSSTQSVAVNSIRSSPF